MRSPALVLLSLLLLTGCSSGRPHVSLPTTAADPALEEQLLQLNDAPALSDRRVFSSPDRTMQATPQLALCKPTSAVGPHQLASVLAKPTAPGQAQVFEILASFADATVAGAAFTQADTDARACPSYTLNGTSYRLVGLAAPHLAGASRTLQYQLTTADVVEGDHRTIALAGRHLVLITGYGRPPAGTTTASFQAGLMVKALARLRS